MSDQQAQGSNILKILILLVAIILIAVIIIPGQIWDNEERIKNITHSDIESLYEAQTYYYKLHHTYAADMDTLLNTVNNDSALKINKQIVDYTTDIKTAIDDFLANPIIKSLEKVTQNVNNIATDFENNEIYFKKYDDIYTKAKDLRFKVEIIQAGVEQEDYAMIAKALDSLLTMRRELQDYQLQVAAQRAHHLTQSIVNKLPGVDFEAIISYWTPLNSELTDLMRKVNSTDLKTRTAVADRVEDFQIKVSSGFRSLQTSDTPSEIQKVKDSADKVKAIYEKFLTDFLITEKFVQYRLSDKDSMILNLDKSNFYTPYDNTPYEFQFLDTLGLVVEDPTLVQDLREMTADQIEAVKKLPFMNAYAIYLNTLDSINTYADEVKQKYRRNAEIHFKTKDINAVIDELKNTSTLVSYKSLDKFVTELPTSNSFSTIKSLIENGLLGIGVFKQIAASNIFGKLDSVHLDLINEMQNYNELLSGIRRNQFTFDSLITQINTDLAHIKSTSTTAGLLEDLNSIEPKLQQVFLFASEGKEESVYGVFSTRIVNHGKMYGRTGEKSWEEE